MHPFALIADECSANLDDRHAYCADETLHTAAIRCCDATGSCVRSVCDASGYPPSAGVDAANATYYEAAAECQVHGLVL
eukprot:6466922-Prymnesium_polylepis.1